MQAKKEYTAKRGDLCIDCKRPVGVPFDNGDGEVRCAACAVDRYMKLPGAKVVLTESIFSRPLA